MESELDVQTYIDRGKQALAQGQGRDAAIAYAHAAQIEPDNPFIHLGLAEANLALGAYGVVFMACKKVQELQPEGVAATMAQALLNLLDRNYDRALQNLEAVIAEDPANGYAHAMRGYLLRVTGHDYDAGLARSRAARLSYGGTYENDFPPVEPARAAGYNGNGTAMPTVDAPVPGAGRGAPRVDGDQIPNWNRTNVQRQVIRTRFWMSQNPRFVTNILIAINALIFAITAVVSATQAGGLPGGNIDTGVLYNFGAQVGSAIPGHNDIWRIFTAMFLHFNFLHIGLNMLSLFFIGPAVEVFYGKLRYLTIYLLSGIAGGVATFFFAAPNSIAAGASGAIFGIFGALGVFYIVNRRALGSYGTGAITNWVFWLGLNLVFGFTNAGIGITDHIGGLVAGMILSALLIPRLRGRRVL